MIVAMVLLFIACCMHQQVVIYVFVFLTYTTLGFFLFSLYMQRKMAHTMRQRLFVENYDGRMAHLETLLRDTQNRLDRNSGQ